MGVGACAVSNSRKPVSTISRWPDQAPSARIAERKIGEGETRHTRVFDDVAGGIRRPPWSSIGFKVRAGAKLSGLVADRSTESQDYVDAILAAA